MGSSVLQKVGPFEPGTMTLVAVEDGTKFSYRPPGKPAPRLPEPGERVQMLWTTGKIDSPSGEGLVVSVVDEGHVYGYAVMVLWSVQPRRFLDDDGDHSH